MDDIVVLSLVLGIVIASIIGLIFYLQFKIKEGDDAEVVEKTKQAAAVIPRGNRAAANRNARNRMRAVLAERRGEDLSEEEEVEAADLPAEQLESNSEQDPEDVDEGPKVPSGKVGKKKAAKLEAKAMKREQRIADDREREEQREKDAIKAEEEKQKEDAEAAEEEQLLAEQRKLQEEKERKELEEYEKMKSMFSVEETGFDQLGDEEQAKDLLREFINYIKHEKVVVLEELAARFQIKTQAAINRVSDLQADGTLTGVMDDRGKFIYISPVELEGFAKFIRQRGRVTLSELAEASATLISLTPEAPIQA